MHPAPLVTVFGSLHYDVMVNSPGRPRRGETLAGTGWFPKCGGKGGNQAIAAVRAGGQGAMIGAVGDDDFGRALLANLDRSGVDRRHVRVEAAAKSGMSVAIVETEGDYGAIIVSGANLCLGAADVSAARGLLAETAILVLQNEVPDAANAAAAMAAKQLGVRVLLNAAPARRLSRELSQVVDVLVVNAVEAGDLSGRLVHGPQDALGVAEDLARSFPHVVVTLGGDGLVYAGQDAAFSLPAMPVKVVCTHGAGDEFIGTMAVHLAEGASMRSALIAANAAAAKFISTPEATA